MKRESLSGTCRDARFERDPAPWGHAGRRPHAPGLQPGRPLAGRLTRRSGAASGYYFWEVGTWKRGPFDPQAGRGRAGTCRSSPPMADRSPCPTRANQIRLMEVATGRTIAHLDHAPGAAPRAAGLQPRRYPADRFDRQADRLDLGPPADPRAIADHGPGLGSTTLSAGGGDHPGPTCLPSARSASSARPSSPRPAARPSWPRASRGYANIPTTPTP